MSAWDPESGVMKDIVVKYKSQENECDLLETRDNGGISVFDKESVNSADGMNV